ncbi:MAG: hypothetical protein AAF357_04465, partial [Verrucomicrobiota bacterium]
MKPLLLLLILCLAGVFAYPGTRVKVMDLASGKIPEIKVPASIAESLKSVTNRVTDDPSEDDLATEIDLRNTPRQWTFADGSQLDAVILAADSKNAQIRVLKTQGVAQVKLDVFAENERETIQSWVESEGENGIAGFPIRLKTHDWPSQWKTGNSIPLKQIENSNRWRSPHFEIVNKAGINRESLEAIVMICESVDGALRSLPLPLPVNWGRPTSEVRKIVIEQSDPTDQMVTTAGYWDGRTGIVHIFSDFLIEPDHQFVVFEFDKPEKVQKYDVI